MATVPALPPGFVLEDGVADGLPPPPPGFELEPEGSTQTPLRHPDGRLTEAGWAAEMEAQKGRRQQKIDEQSFWDNLAAGYGRAMPVLWSGIKQAGTSALRNLVSDSTGLTGTTPMESLVSGEPVGSNALTRMLDRSLSKQQREIDLERRDSVDLMGTGGGMLGYVAGNVVPAVATGGYGAARGAPALASALLPRTLAGNVAQGAAYGAVQPTATGENRLQNIGLGGAAGGGGYALSQAPRLLNALPSVRRAGLEARAGGILDALADNPTQVRNILGQSADIVPGSLPTTAEATGDIGLASLQRTMQSNNLGGFNNLITARHSDNNLARVDAIRSAFGGADDAAAEAIERTRDQSARQVLRPISNISMPDIVPIQQAVDRLIEKNQSAPLVREALGVVKSELPNIKTVQDAHNVRQYIGQLTGGQVEGKAGAKLAQKELMSVTSILDREMSKAFPEWGDFLRTYKDASREAGQVRFGARILDKSNASRDANQNPVLNANTLRALGSPDSVARLANPTFKRANADAMLTQPQKDVIDSVRRDLERQMNTLNRGRAVGSNTFQNLSGSAALQEVGGPLATAGLTAVDPSSGLALAMINGLRKRGGERVAMLVSEAMMDPQFAAEILARVPSQHRQMAIGAVANVLRQGAPSLERTRQSRRPPLEIEIIGGRRESEL